jgi:uncharacterized protein (TIGR00369 family)
VKSEPPFHPYLGLEINKLEEGQAEATLELGPQHLNRRGVAHGGVIAALLDSALGAAVVSSIPVEWWCATTSLSAQFISGPGPGRLKASGRVVRRGRHVAFATGQIEDAQGRLVATGQGTWHLWDHKPGAAPPRRSTEGLPPPHAAVRFADTWIPVSKIVCVGRNYAEHAAEMGAATDQPPVLFLKPPSALTHDRTVRIPTTFGQVHHEVELVVLIGKRGTKIARDNALDHVLGYGVGLDLTLRDLQSEAKKKGDPWTLAKGFDGSAPISSFVPRDAVGDGHDLAIELEVNRARRQHSTTSLMMQDVSQLVSYASSWMTLERGDLIFTGTPAGVGALKPGDRVSAKIEKVGTLELTIEGS